MYTHAPKDYACPFCRIVDRIEDDFVDTKQQDVFYRDAYITAFVSSHWWPNNDWQVLIIPNKHIENIYSLPDSLSNRIHAFEKKVAIALKELYWCDGVSSRQHNEPPANQDVFHYHVSVFPRYYNDRLYQLHEGKYKASEDKRLYYASKLKKYFE